MRLCYIRLIELYKNERGLSNEYRIRNEELKAEDVANKERVEKAKT